MEETEVNVGSPAVDGRRTSKKTFKKVIIRQSVRQRKDVGAPVRLPAMYSNVGQRSARSGNDLAVDTLRSFENQLGLGSRDYAARCLALAQRFNERRPWLQQVRQAVAIATTGVRRVYSQQPHFFAADNSVA